MAWQFLGENVTRVGTNSTLVIPLGAYPSEDGWIALGIITPREWEALSNWIYEVTGNSEVLKIIKTLEHKPTSQRCIAERSLLREGGSETRKTRQTEGEQARALERTRGSETRRTDLQRESFRRYKEDRDYSQARTATRV